MPIPVPDVGGEFHFASSTDLEDALNRPLTTDETSRAQRRLDRAQALLAQDARLPDFLARVIGYPTVALAIDPAVAAEVIATMVARQWRNPEGLLNKSVTVGPYTESGGYGERVGGEQVGRGELVVTQADVDKLTRQGSGFSTGGTIRTTPLPPFAPGVCGEWSAWRPGA